MATHKQNMADLKKKNKGTLSSLLLASWERTDKLKVHCLKQDDIVKELESRIEGLTDRTNQLAKDLRELAHAYTEVEEHKSLAHRVKREVWAAEEKAHVLASRAECARGGELRGAMHLKAGSNGSWSFGKTPEEE